MANVVCADTVFVDGTGSITTKKGAKIYGILFTPDAAFDELLITDGNGGSNKLYCREAIAKSSKVYAFGESGITFPNGIYIATLTSGAKAVLLVSGV